MKLIPNMGTIDRLIRISMGISLATYAIMSFTPIIIIPIIIIMFTVTTKWCFMYQMFGLNTGCHINPKEKKGRNNVTEGLALSVALLIILMLIYLITKYIMLNNS
jgi:hypothetical protein